MNHNFLFDIDLMQVINHNSQLAEVQITLIYSQGNWFWTIFYKPLKTDLLWAMKLLIDGICFVEANLFLK